MDSNSSLDSSAEERGRGRGRRGRRGQGQKNAQDQLQQATVQMDQQYGQQSQPGPSYLSQQPQPNGSRTPTFAAGPPSMGYLPPLSRLAPFTSHSYRLQNTLNPSLETVGRAIDLANRLNVRPSIDLKTLELAEMEKERDAAPQKDLRTSRRRAKNLAKNLGDPRPRKRARRVKNQEGKPSE